MKAVTSGGAKPNFEMAAHYLSLAAQSYNEGDVKGFDAAKHIILVCLSDK